MRSKKALIVGVDPGSTSAIAALDLDGEIQLLESGKNFPPSEIIERIIKVGSPVVVASDKGKTPSTVDDIRTSLGAELFEPDEDLGSVRKRKMGKGSNSHEKDAVASALYAYKNLQREIKKIEEYEDKLEIGRSEVAKRYFSDRPLEPEKEKKVDIKEEREVSEKDTEEDDREKKRLKRKIENLEEQIEALKSDLGEEKKGKKRLRDKYDDLKEEKRNEIVKNQEISKREGIIKEKNKEIDELEEKIGKAEIREQQYREAISSLKGGAEIVPIIDGRNEEVPERAVTRSAEIKERLKKRGFNIHKVEEIEGVELKDYHVAEDFPDTAENLEEVIEDYRDSR